MDEPRIAMAASPREWAQALHRHVADHGGARVRATVLHQQDAVAEDYDVFVGDDSTSFLTRRLVDELHRRGRCVLGVFDPDDPRGKGDLVDMGADDVIARDAEPAAFVTAILALRDRQRRPAEEALDALVSGLGGLADAKDGDAAERGRGPVRAGRLHGQSGDTAFAGGKVATPAAKRGRILAVGAAGGGTGATEVAIALAQALGERGDRTTLVDVDEVAPAVAQRLGLPLYPNVRAAVDAVEHRTTTLEVLLADAPGGRFAVLPGLSTPRTWQELQPTEAVEVLRCLSTGADTVVANVGPTLEDLQGSGGPSRYGVTRAVLGAADVVVVVAQPSPVGLARLLHWLGDVRALSASSALHVVFNRAPTSTFQQRELADELARSLLAAGVWFTPDDQRVPAAAWAGRLVAGGPFLKAIATAAACIVPQPARATSAIGGGRLGRARRRVRT